MQKFNELMSMNKSHKAPLIKQIKRFVIIMPSRKMTHIEYDTLAKGLDFSITSKTLPNKDIVATIEYAYPPLENNSCHIIVVYFL